MNWSDKPSWEVASSTTSVEERRNFRRVELGASLKHARQRAGWTQEQVAKVLGYSRSHIHRVEQGLTELGIADLEILSERFGLPLGRLIGNSADDQFQVW